MNLQEKVLILKYLANLLYHFALTFVPMALPLAILLASLMTFGNMGEFSELSALKSSGIPLQRIMRPLIVLIGIHCNCFILLFKQCPPLFNRKSKNSSLDIRRKKPDINIQAGTFYNGVPDFSIKITTKDPVTNRLDNLIIYDHRDKKRQYFGNTCRLRIYESYT